MAGAGIHDRWHFPKFVEEDADSEIVNLRTFGSKFHRRQVVTITLANSIVGTEPYQFPQALTYFQAGFIGVDWILGTTTPGAVIGPTADNMLIWLRGNHGVSTDPAVTLFYNLYASGTDDFYLPPSPATTFASSWTQIYENIDVAASKTITFGAGVTTPTGSTLVIPPGTMYKVTFEVTGVHTVRIMELVNLLPGASGGIIVPAGPPGFVVQTGTGTQTTTLVGGQNITVTNGTGNPVPTTIAFNQVGAHTAGLPMDRSDVLVWDASLVPPQWAPSYTTVNNSQRNGAFPGLMLGGNNSIQAATNTAISYAIGDRTASSIYRADVGSTALTQANTYANFMATNGASPNWGVAGTHAFADASYFSQITAPAAGPAGPTFDGAGAYHVVGTLGAKNFGVTAAGQISTFLPLPAVAGTTLVAGPASGIHLLASRQEFKENIADLTNLKSDTLFAALNPVTFNFISDAQNIARGGFIVQQAEALLDPVTQELFTFGQGDGAGGWDLTFHQDFSDRTIVALLVNQLKRSQAALAALTLRVTALEA